MGVAAVGEVFKEMDASFTVLVKGALAVLTFLGCSVYLLSLMHLGAVTITCSVLKTCRAEKEKYLKTAGMFDQARLFTSLYLKW